MKLHYNKKKFFSLMILFIGIMMMIQTVSLSFAQELPGDESKLQEMVSDSLEYVHKADLNRAAMNILLNGIELENDEFIILYDSTPFASKGHIALNIPCDPENPYDPTIKVLVGRAPDMFVMPVGYVEQISSPPKMCVYHGQFGFGDPVTDVILKYTSDDESDDSITFDGPHSIAITTHESYIPLDKSFKEEHHNATQTSN